MIEDKVKFSLFDLEVLGIHTALGVLQAVPIVSYKKSVYYNFLHLSIKELLAAYYISWMSGSEQVSQFKRLFNQSRFAAVFQFYAWDHSFSVGKEVPQQGGFSSPNKTIPHWNS